MKSTRLNATAALAFAAALGMSTAVMSQTPEPTTGVTTTTTAEDDGMDLGWLGLLGLVGLLGMRRREHTHTHTTTNRAGTTGTSYTAPR